MDNNRLSILDLNEDCQREIIKYIIGDCEMGDISKNKMKYADLINFALAHENFEAIFKDKHYEDLYKSLEYDVRIRRKGLERKKLEIDFTKLELKHTGTGGDAFWQDYANAISENNVLCEVILLYNEQQLYFNYAESFEDDDEFEELLKYARAYLKPTFLNHFKIIKRALENKETLKKVIIRLEGYSLDDLNNFGNIRHLDLDVRMSAKALVEVCKSNPHLEALYFRRTEILGRLSDIAPHCPNLKYLDFVPKPDDDGMEYAPLAELPKLKEITVNINAFTAEDDLKILLKILEAVPKWNRPGLQPLLITFFISVGESINLKMARTNYISSLQFLFRHFPGVTVLRFSYDYWDIHGDRSPLELATIPLIAESLKIDYKGLTLYECPTSARNMNGLTSILKQWNIKNLNFKFEFKTDYDALFELRPDFRSLYQKKTDITQIAKLVAFIISDESYALKSINTGFTEIDQSVTSEYVKIKSITSLTGRFSDWESVELLSALTNLETVNVFVQKKFEINYSKALCNLINTCSKSGVIKCVNWRIEFRKIESIINQRKRITALTLCDHGEAISHIFEAFSYTDLITIEELDVSKYVSININDILKMAEVHPIKKLRISLANTKCIKYLSVLAKLEALEDLTIHDSIKGSLTELFKQMEASPSLQSLKIHSKELSSEELVQVSKIKSLKKLELCVSKPVNCQWLMELANSNIEELILPFSYSLRSFFFAFAAKTTTRLKHLKIKHPYGYPEIFELEEISKIKSIKSLRCAYLHYDVSFLRNFKHLVKLDIVTNFVTNLEALLCFSEFEKLESLTLRLNKHSLPQNYDILADIQNLKELKLLVDNDVNVNLTNVYQAFVSKNVKLTHLITPIGCVEELNEITQIKTLRKLHLFVGSIGKKLRYPGELSELESLQITVLTSKNAHILDSDDDYTLDSDDDYKMDCVLPILRCCRNLERLLFNSNDSRNRVLRGIHTHLKSIRNPTLQGPLTIILTEVQDINEEYNIPEILVILFENVYFKLFTSSSLLKG